MSGEHEKMIKENKQKYRKTKTNLVFCVGPSARSTRSSTFGPKLSPLISYNHIGMDKSEVACCSPTKSSEY